MFAVLTVVRMVSASQEDVVATLDGRETCAISCRAMRDVVNMASAKTGHVCVHRVGTGDIARCVSIKSVNSDLLAYLFCLLKNCYVFLLNKTKMNPHLKCSIRI